MDVYTIVILDFEEMLYVIKNKLKKHLQCKYYILSN